MGPETEHEGPAGRCGSSVPAEWPSLALASRSCLTRVGWVFLPGDVRSTGTFWKLCLVDCLASRRERCRSACLFLIRQEQPAGPVGKECSRSTCWV